MRSMGPVGEGSIGTLRVCPHLFRRLCKHSVRDGSAMPPGARVLSAELPHTLLSHHSPCAENHAHTNSSTLAPLTISSSFT